MENDEVARIFYEIADILELQDVQFKPTAYRRAGQAIEALDRPLSSVEDFTSIQGVGKAIAKKIEEILTTGSLEYLETLKEEIPPGIQELLHLPDVGPKTAHNLARQGIHSIEELTQALQTHSLGKMKGFGHKTEENLARSIQLYVSQRKRRPLGSVLPLTTVIEETLSPHCNTVVIVGSVRRWKETVGDIDILAITPDSEQVMEAFTRCEPVKTVLSRGTTRSSVIMAEDIQADLRVVTQDSFGSALQYFTGSKDHNVALRRLAVQKGFKLNEYGLFDRKTNDRVAGESEEEIYACMGLDYIPPELREYGGEIEAARTHTLPPLLELGDMRGDLHVHTSWSDGSDSIPSLIEAALALDYEYMGISDHSRSSTLAHGLTQERLSQQNALIERLNDDLDDITVLSGVECDIMSDGSLDFPDSVLEQLDFVTASVHSRFTSSREKMTDIVCNAMRNEFVTILGHPTGRIMGTIEPLNLDMGKIFDTARETDTLMEINAHPLRLDLKDTHIRTAIKEGVSLVIGTDAHAVSELDRLELGVRTARRGWAGPAHIINTYGIKELKKNFKTP